MSGLERLLPFLAWFPIARATLRADLVAGITVALILVPQSMAYAQLAGLPAHYGLYTAFVPVLVAGLWGSSGQLSTGPVAMVSLLTAAALTPIAAQGSEGLRCACDSGSHSSSAASSSHSASSGSASS